MKSNGTVAMVCAMLFLGVVNLITNPHICLDVKADVYEGACDLTTAPCCTSGADPVCNPVTLTWSCP